MTVVLAMAATSALLLVFAVAVRFAGGLRLLRVVDYARVGDVRALHAWAGGRLLLTAIVGFALSALAAAVPYMQYFLLAGLLLGVLSSAIALSTGAARFQS